MSVFVGFSPGGGYDTTSRATAAHIGKYLPGEPDFVVRNVTGAGGVRGLQAIDRAPADGLSIGVMHPRFINREVLGTDVEGFDVSTIRVLGGPTGARSPGLFCTRRDVATSFEEVIDKGIQLVVPSVEPGSTKGTGPQFLELVGAPVKNVYGYGGSSALMAAFNRGEGNALAFCTPSEVPRLFPEWVEDEILAPLAWWGGWGEDEERLKEWLDRIGFEQPVPYILDIPALDLSETEKTVFKGKLIASSFQRSWVMHPDTPDDLFAAWKEAYEKTQQDPEYRAVLKRAGYGPVAELKKGDDFAPTIKKLRELPPEAKDILSKLVGG